MSGKLILIFILISGISFAQSSKLIERIYFDSDKFEIKEEEALKLDKLWDLVSDKSILQIQIVGNTDNDADSLYNLTLSKNRCLAIQDFFTSKNVNKKLILINYFGENRPIATNNNETGKQKNRRVDIRIKYETKKVDKIEKAKTITIPKPRPVVKAKDPCLGVDTTIILSNGTELILNKCEYNNIAECLEINSVRTTDELIENGNLLTTDQGQPLVTCGMISVCLSPSKNCNLQKTTFNTPIKVRFPISDDRLGCSPCGTGVSGLFNMNNDGSWSEIDQDEEKIKIVEVNNRTYLEMEIDKPNCGGMKNFDVLRCGDLSWWKRRKYCPNVKVKLPMRYTLLSAQIFIDCPTTVLNYLPRKFNKNVGKTKTKCYSGDHRIQVLAIDAKGDTVRVELGPLYPIKHSILSFGKCKSIHRKYKIRKRDFGRKANNSSTPIFLPL